MKKSLSLVLALAMVFTMFASVAFAADATTTASTDAQTKFEALKDKGIMTGTVVDGQVVAGLDLNMDRASFAEVLVNLYNLPKVATTSSFSDVPADHWALQQIEAAKTAGYMLGNGDGTFNPDGKITLQELASALCEANGLEPVANAEVAGADDWAAGYVAAAVNAKLLASVSDYTAAATRADLVVGTYQTYENVQAATAPSATFSATGAKELTVTFNHAVDSSKAAITVNKGTIPVNVNTTTWSADKTSVEIALVAVMTAGDYTVTVKGVSNDALTGKVTVDDQKASKITFDSDKAAYARTPVTGEPITSKVTTSFKVLNQYGEDVTSTYASQVKVTSGLGSAGTPSSNGSVTIDNGATNTIMLGQQIPVSAVYAYNSVFATASATLTVSAAAQAATVSISKVYNADDDTLTAGADLPTDGEFDILFTAKDQYGNDIAVTNDNANLLENDLLVTGSNNAVVYYDYASNKPVFGTITVDDTDYFTLQLKNPTSGALTAGTSTIYIMSNTTGNKASIDVAVKDTVKVDTLTLSAPTIAVDGEKTTIPFTAVDQFGQAITDADDITNGLNGALTVSGVTGLTATFSQDYVKDEPVLTLDAETDPTDIEDPTTIYISGVTKTYKIVQMTLTLQPAKKPVVISGITDDTKKAIAEGADTSLANDGINILDQYGRAFTLADFDGYNVGIESSATDKVSVSVPDDASTPATSVDNTDTSVDLNGLVAGSSTITLTINDGTDDVANSAYNFNVRVVKQADIASYKVEDVAKVFTGTTDGSTVTISSFDDYAQDVTVVGLLSDGKTEVAVPTGDSRYYTVNVNSDLTYSSVTGSVYGTDNAALATDTDADKKYTLVVVGNTTNGVQTITKDVTVSTVAPKVTTLALDDGDFTSVEGDGVISISVKNLNGVTASKTKEQIAEDAVSVQDQYGKDVADADKFTSVIASNFSESTRNSVGTVHAGDTFTITAIDSATGSVKSFKVVVKD